MSPTLMVSPSGLKPVGLPVIHSSSGKVAKTLPTTNRPRVCNWSLEFSQPMISPLVRANPLLIASYMPLSGSLIHPIICHSYLHTPSPAPPSHPPPTFNYSRFG